jgi:hypothetical protein
MILPSTVIGIPPSTGLAPRNPRRRNPAPPPATGILDHFGRAPQRRGRHCFVLGNCNACRLRVVSPLEVDYLSCVVDDRDRDRPAVLARFRIGRGSDLARLVERDVGAYCGTCACASAAANTSALPNKAALNAMLMLPPDCFSSGASEVAAGL